MLLQARIDALDIGFSGSLSGASLIWLATAQAAGAMKDRGVGSLGVEKFLIERKGRQHHRFVLRNAHAEILVSTGDLEVRARPALLLRYGLSQTIEYARLIARTLDFATTSECVRRIDACADVQAAIEEIDPRAYPLLEEATFRQRVGGRILGA